MKVIVIGGGWSGIAAAVAAKKAGAEVHIFEKTDLLLGLGNVGGIMRNNGRYTGCEELIALGCGDLFKITDADTLHKDVSFPGHNHAWLYNTNRVESDVKRYVKSIGINIHLISRVVDVKKNTDNPESDVKIEGIYLSDGTYVSGDVFVETTGSTGPMGNCLRYGNGCSMCILRCPAFGPRVSISSMARVYLIIRVKEMMELLVHSVVHAKLEKKRFLKK